MNLWALLSLEYGVSVKVLIEFWLRGLCQYHRARAAAMIVYIAMK